MPLRFYVYLLSLPPPPPPPHLSREWYSYHFPELVKLVPDNYMYARTVKLIGSRKEFTEDKLEKLEAIVMDSTKVEAIYEAAKVSMGKRHIGSRGYGFLPVAPLSSKMCVCVCVWGGGGG